MSSVFGLLFIVIACVATAPAQSSEFHRVQLTPKGRAAYDRLLSAYVFRVGPVGYGAVTSQEEFALYDLLDEAHAIEALKSLVTDGSYEGGLYGLVGLSLKNNGEFNRAVEVYNARRDERKPESTTAPMTPARYLNVTSETVATQSGCIFMTLTRAEVVKHIQSGRYDRVVDAIYRPGR